MLPRVEVQVTADTAQAEAGLERVQKKTMAAANASVAASGRISTLGRTFQQNGFAISNAANQFSDLAVQIGMGVPATRALSQQLPQLTAFMGPLANIIGVASGVLIGLAGNFFLAGENAKTFQDDIDELRESTTSLKDELFLLQQGLDNLAQVPILREIQAITEEIANRQREIAELEAQGGRTATQKARTLRALVAADQERLAALQAQLEENKQLTSEVEAAKEATKELASVQLVNIQEAANSAAQLAANLGVSLELAQRLMASGNPRFAGANSNGLDAMDPRNPNNTRPIWAGEYGRVSPFDPSRLPSAAARAGGGGSTALDILDEELTAQEQRIKEHFDRIGALTQDGLSDKLGGWGNYFSNLVSMTGSNNKKLLGIAKAAQSAQALMDAWSAYGQVLKDPSFIGRPWARVAAAGQVLAAGIGAVNAIKGISESGSGSGSAGAIAGATGGGAISAQPTQAVYLNLQGDTFSRASVEGLLEQIQSRLDRGGRLVFE